MGPGRLLPPLSRSRSPQHPLGGETTIIALDRTLTRTGRFPALDLVNSGTLRPELLVGDAGAQAIAKARAEASGV